MPRRMTTAVNGSPAYSRMRRCISFTRTPVTIERCSSSASRARLFFGRSAGQMSMLVPSVFLTRTRPSRSSMSPRCASIGSVRTRLLFALARYLSPESTWSAHSRSKSTANTVSARKPSTATRRASCGVRRYGSSTRGSRGRKRRLRGSSCLLPKETHLVRAVGDLDRREQPAHEAVDGPGQEQVPEDDGRQRYDDLVCRYGAAEEEAEREGAEGVEDGHDQDRQVRGVEAVARGRLAVAPDPEASNRQEQRREPQRVEVGDVDEQARAEPGDGAEDRAAEEGDREQHDEQQVGAAAERRVTAEDGHLHEHGDEEEGRSLQGVHQRCFTCWTGFGFGTRTSTDCSDERSANGWTWICLKMSVSFWPTLVTAPTGMLPGKIDGSLLSAGEPAVAIVSRYSTRLSLPTRVSESVSPALPCMRIPTAPGPRWSIARTALSPAVISMTRDTAPNTFVTWPTRPS